LVRSSRRGGVGQLSLQASQRSRWRVWQDLYSDHSGLTSRIDDMSWSARHQVYRHRFHPLQRIDMQYRQTSAHRLLIGHLVFRLPGPAGTRSISGGLAWSRGGQLRLSPLTRSADDRPRALTPHRCRCRGPFVSWLRRLPHHCSAGAWTWIRIHRRSARAGCLRAEHVVNGEIASCAATGCRAVANRPT
jgi:hypothetical protein